MLAESPNSVQSGMFGQDIHLAGTAKRGIVDFIARELPNWRDHPDRPVAEGEDRLTEYLCDYLNGASRKSVDWSHIQFRTETADEADGRRRIDLAPKPLDEAVFVDTIRHTQFDTLFPIECKRLPTPTGKDRDEREYVWNNKGTTGGMQRYKLGHHGATHTFAVMIAYVQSESCPEWYARINGWIRGLSVEPNSPWRDEDLLRELDGGPNDDVSRFESRHRRDSIPGELEMQHVWIRMNSPIVLPSFLE